MVRGRCRRVRGRGPLSWDLGACPVCRGQGGLLSQLLPPRRSGRHRPTALRKDPQPWADAAGAPPRGDLPVGRPGGALVANATGFREAHMDSHTAVPLGGLGQAWGAGGSFWRVLFGQTRCGPEGAGGRGLWRGWEALWQGCRFLEDLGRRPSCRSSPRMRRWARGAQEGWPGPRETLTEEPQRGRGRCVLLLDRRAQGSPP